MSIGIGIYRYIYTPSSGAQGPLSPFGGDTALEIIYIPRVF
jgi:hypothetical protein